MKILLVFFIASFCIIALQAQESKSDNPFLKEWNTPFKTPPFNEIRTEHFLPAFEEGIRRHTAEIDAICGNKDQATFQNTIEAMEKSGQLLAKVNNVFSGFSSANTSEEIQGIAKKTAPMLAQHEDDVNLNEKLFARIRSIYDSRDKLNLTPEQKTVVTNYYLDFVRGGVNLSKQAKDKFRKINEELSVLVVKFGNNILKETNAVGLVVDNKDDLAGLPENAVQAAFETGKAKGLEGKWAFTLQRASWIPFLQYSVKRDLRQKLFTAYLNRGNNNNEADTKKILSRIAALRVEKAKLLGYKTHADFVLARNMAKNPKAVLKFLNDIWKPAVNKAMHEAGDMQKIIDREGSAFKLSAWDWWYYAEKLKKEKYDLDEEALRPYFKLENVLNGVFTVVNKLYGITFAERKDISVYNPDVKVFEVKEADGKHIGILYTDYFPRDNKRSGAWCSEFRTQSNIGGNFIAPLTINCGNFSKPTADKPALLSVSEVTTLFHEFGHALHSLFSNISLPNGAGLRAVDFVELPSQIMEHWAMHPDVLPLYATHYKTGDVMPRALIEKLENAKHFNQGFTTVEYLAASFLDMSWHTIADAKERDVPSFEKKALAKIGLLPEIESRYQSTNFQHIFSGMYSAGYYSYLWAQVLDADAFDAFNETGLFDKATAASFRKNVLSTSGSEGPMSMYVKFRGREPKVDALLRKRGLK